MKSAGQDIINLRASQIKTMKAIKGWCLLRTTHAGLH